MLCQRGKVKREIDEELQFHLEQRTAENIAGGMSPEDAAREARKRFGNMQSVREECRDRKGAGFGEAIWRDVRFSLRILRKNPGFTAVAVLTLAICIGANLAIFAVVDAILVRSLPFPEADRLVTVFDSYPRAGLERAGNSIADYYDRGDGIKAFESVAIFQEDSAIVGQAGSPDRVSIARISPEFFATLGVPLARGRSFTDTELVPGSDGVAILTDGFWRSHFNADPDVVGRTFLNDGLVVTVVGVLPRDFRFLSSHAQFFRPAAHDPVWRQPDRRHNNKSWTLVARLAPGATLARAQAQLNGLNARNLAGQEYAQAVRDTGFHSVVRLLHDDHVRAIRPTLLLLQCGVFVLLLIGGLNLGNLLLIRASGRTREVAVRQALGAGRLHIMRAVVVETTLLALFGGVAGLLLGWLGIHLLAVLGLDQLPLGASVQFDGRLAAVSLIVLLLVGVLLAVPIIWFHLRTSLGSGLRVEVYGGTSGRAAQGLRHAFMAAQIALAFVLLSGAGLLGVSLKRVLETPTGFRAEHLLTGRLVLAQNNYNNDAARRDLVERLLPALRALPGVTHAAINTSLPFGMHSQADVVTVEGAAPVPGKSLRIQFMSAVAGDYWQTMGIPLIEGRGLEDADMRRKQRVCVVDQAFARRYWPGISPLGRRFTTDAEFDEADAWTVVGVAGDVKQNDLANDDIQGAFYIPYGRVNANDTFFAMVRATLPPAVMGPMIRKAVLQIDPELPIDDLKPMQARIDDSLVARRSPAILAAIFAGVALLLSAIGTYGVLAYAVSQRRREIGVRMALGALPGQVGRQFLALGLRLLGIGTVLGIGGAWLAGRAMQSILFEVPTFPVTVLAATAIILGVVAVAACLLPAFRAARVNPTEVLRHE